MPGSVEAWALPFEVRAFFKRAHYVLQDRDVVFLTPSFCL
jgi:hypothetical protein